MPTDMTKTILAGLLIAAASPSIAAEPPPPPTQAKKQSKQVVDENGTPLVCKKVRFTGSRLAKDMCASAAEWKEMEKEGHGH